MAGECSEFRLAKIRADDGVEIPARVYGEQCRRTPLVMLHGLRSHAGWFGQSARFVASLGHPVYAFDRRGSGVSDEKRGHADSFRDVVDEVRCVAEAAMARHDARHVHVMGHCFGAIPGAILACRYPEKVASLILPTPGIHTQVTVPPLRKFQIGLCQIGARQRYIPFPLAADKLADLDAHRRFIREDSLSLTEITAGFCFQVFRARRYLKNNVHALHAPLFMALAGKDEISNNERNIAFLHAASSRKKRLLTYPDATHILEFSPAKDRFFRDLADWLAETGTCDHAPTEGTQKT
jgi:alpha-beta hydrolase superfamily lysophospholipase